MGYPYPVVATGDDKAEPREKNTSDTSRKDVNKPHHLTAHREKAWLHHPWRDSTTRQGPWRRVTSLMDR